MPALLVNPAGRAALRRLARSSERGPGMSVTILRTCSSSGPPTSAFVIPTAYGCVGNRRMSDLDNRTLQDVRSGQFGRADPVVKRGRGAEGETRKRLTA